MYAVGDAYRLHTECIQAYKKRKERNPSSTSFLYCLFLHLLLLVFRRSSSTVRAFRYSLTNHKHSTACFRRQWAFRAFIARLTGCPPSFRPILVPRSSHAPAGVYAIRPFRRLRCLDGRSKSLYALYASKNRLCALCENTTPELTAYNAYRNEKRRVRRAESTKMYAVGDAYKVHTECIQVNTGT